jgi:hypothetical protein
MVNNRRSWKFQAIRALGGRCSRCGYADWRALQIDHINGGGSHESTNTHEFLERVIRGKDVEFKLLCANCNSIKRCENAEGCRADLNGEFLSSMGRFFDKETLISLC